MKFILENWQFLWFILAQIFTFIVFAVAAYIKHNQALEAISKISGTLTEIQKEVNSLSQSNAVQIQINKNFEKITEDMKSLFFSYINKGT